MTFGDKLIALRKANGYSSRKDFADKLKIPHTTLRNYELNQREPGHSFLIQVAQELNVTVDNLLGIPEKERKDEGPNWGTPLLAAYKQADDSTRRAACNVLQIDYIEPGETYQNMRVMPVYLFPAAAGIPIYAEDDFEELEFPEDQIPNGANFGIRIRGNSMQPTIEDGAIVWVKRQQELQNGQIGVFMLHDEAVCKRFERTNKGIRLLSDNESYAPIEVTDYETFAIVGRVLEYR